MIFDEEYINQIFRKLLNNSLSEDQNEISSINYALKIQDYKECFRLTYEILLLKKYSSENQFWNYNYLRIIAEQLNLEKEIEQLKKIIRTNEKNRMAHFELKRTDAIVNLSMCASNGSTRIGPAFSGYRVPLYFNKYGFSTTFKFLDEPIIFPGESTQATIQLSAPEFFESSLIVNQKFELKEGARVVANGHILEIINESLKSNYP